MRRHQPSTGRAAVRSTGTVPIDGPIRLPSMGRTRSARASEGRVRTSPSPRGESDQTSDLSSGFDTG